MNKLIAQVLLSGAVVAGAAVSGVALADDDCTAPKEEWQSEEALQKTLGKTGWEIERFKIDDGCYEIEGLDEQGRKVEAEFDPKTLEMLEVEREER